MSNTPLKRFYIESVDERGKQIATPTYTIFNAGTSVSATLFADEQGLVSLSNPQSVNPLRFFADAATVDVRLVKGSYTYRFDGVTPNDVRYVFMTVPASIDQPVNLTQLLVSGAGPHAIGGATSTGVGLNLFGFTGPSAVDTFGVQLTAPTTVGGPTNAATLKILGAPTGATNNYALWVVGGTARIGGAVELGSALSFTTALPQVRVGSTALLFMNNAASAERMRLTDAGILALGTTVTTGAVAGDLVLRNGADRVQLVNATGTAVLGLLGLNASDELVLNQISGVGDTAKVVSVSGVDTAGAGFRALRVPN